MAQDRAVITVQVLGARSAEWALTRVADALLGRPLSIWEKLARLPLELAAVIDDARLRWHMRDGRKVDQTVVVQVGEACIDTAKAAQ